MKERGNSLFKAIDCYIGIPLVFLLGLGLHLRRLLRKNLWIPLKTKQNLHILLVKTGAVGDSILLSAIALEIKKKYPKAHISLLCTTSNSNIVPLLTGIDEKIVFALNNILASLKKLRQNKGFDLVIDFAAWPRLNAILIAFVSHSYSVGFKRHKQYRHYSYDKSVTHKDTLHELDNYRNLLHAIGIETTGISPQIRMDLLKKKFATKNTANNHLHELIAKNKKPIILHPFPGGRKKEFKMWPDKNWQDLGQRLVKQGYSLWITGAPSDSEHAVQIVSSIMNGFPKIQANKVLSLAGKLNWEETAWLLSKTRMLISVNTGIMHLAAAIGTKVIALNGPTSTARWGAIGKNVTNFRSTYECSPCLSLGFEYACKAGGCMTRICVDDVAGAVGGKN